MDHAEAREQLELIAIEPGGLDRLVAAAGPESAALLAHLGDCEACRAELDALRRSVRTIRETVQSTPGRHLRAQTLEFVDRLGRTRPVEGSQADAPATAAGPPRRWAPQAWASAFAAGAAVIALLAAVVVGSTLSSRLTEADAALADQRATIAGLALVTDWTLRLGADPDATRVRLEAAGDGPQAGSVLFSSATNELVMVASGLPAPAEGEEYRCWVESGGSRAFIGAMYRAGDLAYWVGELGQMTGEGEPGTFGVSRVPSTSDGVDGEVMLVGEPQAT
jgi:hypothetical protein